MEGATLTINFKDESSQVQGSPATTPQGVGAPAAYSQVDEQQKAITQAGGVGQKAAQAYQSSTTTSSASIPQAITATVASVPVAEPIPTPIVSTIQPSGEAALAASIQKIVAADPRATAEEIAKLLGGGTTAKDVERLSKPTPPPAQPIPANPAVPTQTPFAKSLESLNPIFPFQTLEPENYTKKVDEAEEERKRKAAQDAANKVPQPPPLSRQQIIEQAERNAPPLPGVVEPENVTSQVQTTVNALSHFAHMGGPLGSAIAGTVNSAVAIPSVAQALGTAAPGLVAAAPFAGLALAATAIPAALVATAINEANRSIAITSRFSPEAIGAQALADVRQIQADIRTGRILGDEAAQITDARSRINASLQNIRDRLTEEPLQKFGKVLDTFSSALESINKVVEENPKATSAVRDTILGAILTTILPPGIGVASLVGSTPVSQSPKPPEPLGFAIPQRLKLPLPFSDSTPSEQHITTSGLPTTLRGLGR